ncbi:hypothetical protein PRZ48_006402 [Zasmidium cellare]|uniref:F-box domain-containing protein n=1 Tax=Zasmidium cellare TaxID=395010 RepID=A0ABR0EP06_ZASCE|nr:hypothetical protein PRZ48_006402 [Zasmidium cellare]
MAGDTSIRDDLLSRLAHQPQYIMTGMIKISNPATPSTITRSPHTSADLGRLDKLPLELLHFAFSMLDLKTLSSISRTCLRGLAVVESIPEYRDLIRHAPSMMTALGSTGLIQHHSAHTLHTGLTASQCASCGDFGPFLFLPTCERCCYECLCREQRFRVITTACAGDCFELSAASLKKLPTMHNLRGRYSVPFERDLEQRFRLVSARAVKKLALDEGKSMKVLAENMGKRRHEGFDRLTKWRHIDTLKWLQAAPIESREVNTQTTSPATRVPVDDFGGLASIPFPSLKSTTCAESGLWCLGCEETYRDWDPDESGDNDAARLVAMGSNVYGDVHYTTQVARSEKGFLEHVAHCAGAKEIVPDLEEKLRQMKIA